MKLDPAFLSRLQFALTVGFHYIFPPLTIGLGALMVYAEGMHLRTGDAIYGKAARFWTRLFAITFALGVATGIVMEFQFGTNWSTYSRYVGDVFGSPLAAEGLFAFFLESTFLAVLVFGWKRVSPRVHFFSTVMVFLGSVLSSVWIVVANSWQQTPAGCQVVGGRAEMTDFWAMVFNPSAMHRLGHVWVGALIYGAFFAMAVSARYVLRGANHEFARKTLKVALVFATVASLCALFSGHAQAKNVARTQPAKLAAFEGHFKTGDGGAPLYVFGWPDDQEQRVKAGVALPGMLSLLVHNDASQPVPGLDQFRPQDRPQGKALVVAFQTYHLMVGLGFLFIAVSLLGCFFWWRGTLFEQRWLLWLFIACAVGALVANEVGWCAAEVGRQPWVVCPTFERVPGEALLVATGPMLRTNRAFSPSVPAGQMLASLILFSVIYLALFGVWLHLLRREIRRGPEAAE